MQDLRTADRGILMGFLTILIKARCVQNPSPSLSPVGSSLLGREPAAESFARYWCRVFRDSLAAKPRDLKSQISTLKSFF